MKPRVRRGARQWPRSTNCEMVFVDESRTTIALTRNYGWAPHDQRAVGQVPRNYGKNTTFVAA